MLFLSATQHGVDSVADLDGTGFLPRSPFQELVRPGESFGRFSDEERPQIVTPEG
jgi:hypothetical protein